MTSPRAKSANGLRFATMSIHYDRRNSVFVAIEGLIGAGKSTCMRLLSRKYSATTLAQRYDKHPVLADYYRNPRSNALEKVMIFLYLDYNQLHRNIPGRGLFISDFTLQK